jgi:hypothetical protein
MVTRQQRVAKELRDGKGLEAAAKRLAETLHDPGCPPAAQASIARELRMMLAAIGAKPSAEQGGIVDELLARRKAREAG